MGKSAKLSFKTLSFQEKGNELQVNLLKLFYTLIPNEELAEIGPFNVVDAHTVKFADVPLEKAEKRFSFLLGKYFSQLKNRLTGNPATYIHMNSDIPLIGNVAFGIVYRNSSIIEIKPITSCNLNCIYCSISEGLSCKKQDFVAEKDYLVQELEKLMEFIKEPVEIHIGVQGEPFLYSEIRELIADLQRMEKVHTISVDTNGTLLSKEIIDLLAEDDAEDDTATDKKKLQLNFSLDSLNSEKAKQLAGAGNYNINHIKEIISYTSKKIRTIIAPVFINGFNNDDLEEIISFVKHLNPQPKLGIQNFLRYKTGRNPAKEVPWKEFYQFLENLEKKHGIKLKWTKDDFNVRKTKDLPKPFREGDVVNAVMKCPDRFPNTSIAVSCGRTISLLNCPFRAGTAEKKVKVKIIKDKHNIFTGKIVK